MQEKGEKELLVKQLKVMLDWYTFHAADEEYDESNVENILNLLDSFDPIEAEELPQRDAAWERFRRMAGEKFPERAAQMSNFSGPDSTGTVAKELSVGAAQDLDSFVPERAETIKGELLERSAQVPDSPDLHESLVRTGRFTARHKYIAAAVLLLVILTVGGTAQAIANQDSNFFFWLKRDETGTQMMVSPEGLDDSVNKSEYAYSDIEEAPKWAQEWAQIADKVEMPEGYEFQYFEVSELEYYQGIVGHFMNHMVNEEVLLGAWTYFDKVSYNSEGFDGYIYVQSFEVAQTELEVYKRMEEGDIFYVICFYEGNCRYLVKGQDNLEEVKQLAERYLDCLQ